MQNTKPFKLRYITKYTSKYNIGDFHKCSTDNHDTIFIFKEKIVCCQVCGTVHVFFLDPVKHKQAEKVHEWKNTDATTVDPLS